MKNILVIVVMAVLVGCASKSPSKLERSPCADAIEGRSAINAWE